MIKFENPNFLNEHALGLQRISLELAKGDMNLARELYQRAASKILKQLRSANNSNSTGIYEIFQQEYLQVAGNS